MLRAQCYKTVSSPSSDTNYKSRLLMLLPTGYKSGSYNLPLKFNLLDWLTELKKTVYLLNQQFIIKRYNSGRARRRKYIRQGMGKRSRNFHGLSRHTIFPAPPCAPAKKFPNLHSLGSFMKVSSCRHAVSYKLSLQLLFPPWKWDVNIPSF